MTRRPPRPPDARPAAPAALVHALERLDGGAAWRATFEELLRELEPDAADALMLLTKESRGAWGLLLGASAGRLAFVGNALSGTVTALGELGFELVVVDPSPTRCALARARDRAAGGRALFVAGGALALPLGSRSCDLGVAESGGGEAAAPRARDELQRIARGELVFIADNRLAYKRSAGLRGRFHKPSPPGWLARALRPARGERTLAGYRRALRSVRPAVRAFALYPDSREFSHVVGLDGDGPDLTVGPQERANKLKLAGKALGLFPWLTPSFALLGAGHGSAPRRVDRVLAALEERIGGEPGRVEQLVATRSNVAVVHTSGGWTLHVPLSPGKARLMRRHHRTLELLARDFPDFPAPRPLFHGTLEGLSVTCEERIGGLTGPQVSEDRRGRARLVESVGAHLERLVAAPPTAFGEEEFERLVGDRFRLARDCCAVASTARRIDRMLDGARERLVGLRFPRVLYHADLRAKHLQVRPDGELLAVLDWGTAEEGFLPCVDLVHLVAHQRRQEHRGTPAASWKVLLDRSFHDYEGRALERLTTALGLPEALLRTVETCYPLFVAGMAERNWDYSRPRWVHGQFGL